MPQMISVVGKSQSGKTTFIEKLIPELKKRGYRIGVIKHAFHKFDMDKEGKDSWRHKAAGADTVIVASQGGIAMVKDHPFENLDSLECYFQEADLVITEGFKRGDKPKIEVFRSAAHQSPLCQQHKDDLVALVTDATDVNLDVPRFGLEEIGRLADLIEEKFL